MFYYTIQVEKKQKRNPIIVLLYRVYEKKLNKPEIAHQLCKAPQCTKFFIEMGCLGTDNVV